MKKHKLFTTRQFLFVWLIIFPVFALFISSILFWFGPKEAITEAVCYLFPDRKDNYLQVRVVAHCKGRGDWTHGYVELIGNKGIYAELDLKKMVVIAVTPISTGWPLTNPVPIATLTKPKPLSDSVVLDWYDQAGEDIGAPDVIAEAVELATILKTVHGHGFASLTPTHFQYTDRAQPVFLPALWYVKAITLFWFMVWLAGIVWFFFHKRHQSTYGRKSPPSVPD